MGDTHAPKEQGKDLAALGSSCSNKRINNSSLWPTVLEAGRLRPRVEDPLPRQKQRQLTSHVPKAL